MPEAKPNGARRKSAFGGLTTWLILAGAAGLAWFAYRRWFSSAVPQIPAGAAGSQAVPGAPGTPGAQAARPPMLPTASQPSVRPGETVGTRTTSTITSKEPGYRYMRIIRTTAEGVKQFRSSIRGFFTGRLLNLKGKLYAEVRPA